MWRLVGAEQRRADAVTLCIRKYLCTVIVLNKNTKVSFHFEMSFIWVFFFFNFSINSNTAKCPAWIIQINVYLVTMFWWENGDTSVYVCLLWKFWNKGDEQKFMCSYCNNVVIHKDSGSIKNKPQTSWVAERTQFLFFVIFDAATLCSNSSYHADGVQMDISWTQMSACLKSISKWKASRLLMTMKACKMLKMCLCFCMIMKMKKSQLLCSHIIKF